jgi:hypothetical protein
VRVIKDKHTGESRGFAFVDFADVGGIEIARDCMEKTKARTNMRLAKLFSPDTHILRQLSVLGYHVVVNLVDLVVARFVRLFRVRFSSRRATSVTRPSTSRTASTTGPRVVATVVMLAHQATRLAATGFVPTCA